jgi:hypothetical protein|tara:strand:- start:1388 stop:1945 length:558 start_codon:yes stop_codon:yes gene_type:complete
MIFDKHYIQVDLDKKIFSGSFQLLPENWHNISCFNSLSDEELEDLTWSGNKNIGWIRFTSPKIKEFNVMRDTFLLVKDNLKRDISAAIDDSVDPKITYKNNLIVLNEETKNILVSRYLYSLSDKSVTLKINCMGNYRVFNSEEIKELIFMIDRKNLSIYNKRIKLNEIIDTCNSITDLTSKSYDI